MKIPFLIIILLAHTTCLYAGAVHLEDGRVIEGDIFEAQKDKADKPEGTVSVKSELTTKKKDASEDTAEYAYYEMERHIEKLNSKDALVRRKAAFALRDFSSKKAIAALIGALKDEDVFVRNNAVKALSHIHDPAAKGALLELLKRESDKVTKVNIKKALEGMK